MVSINCITYNHEKYISDAIEGFIMQKTNFRYEVLIHDDASTDKTTEIIKRYEKRYPEIIKPIYQTENQYSQGVKISPTFMYPRSKGKYIAICEGDDFWVDHYKLQKQFEYMEKHIECSMCFHNAKILETKRTNEDYLSILAKPKNNRRIQSRKGEFFYEGGSNAPTSSIFFRKNCISTFPNFLMESPVGDMPLKLLLAQKGEIHYIDETMSVRRKGTPGSWNDRIYNDTSKETAYLQGMIRMLQDYSTFYNMVDKFSIEKKIMEYNNRLDKINIINIYKRKKNIIEFIKDPLVENYMNRLNKKGKALFFVELISPNLFNTLLKLRRKLYYEKCS